MLKASAQRMRRTLRTGEAAKEQKNLLLVRAAEP